MDDAARQQAYAAAYRQAIAEGDVTGASTRAAQALVAFVVDQSDNIAEAQAERMLEELSAFPPITSRQLRLTLVRNGIALDDVAAMIEAMPEGLAKEEARIEWDDASQFERLHPTLLLIAEGLGMTREQVDGLWGEAVGA